MASVTRKDKGLTITLADCICTCSDIPTKVGNPTSEELCSKCGHAHSTVEYTMLTPEGPKQVRMSLRSKPKP